MVAMTGSFGKTSTKQHIAHLVAGSRHGRGQPGLVQQPGRTGSGRQRAAWLRAPTSSWRRWAPTAKGEIADLCRWCPPAIAVITAIGPVHLERFKTEDAIVAAKAEITETAHTVVLNVDDRPPGGAGRPAGAAPAPSRWCAARPSTRSADVVRRSPGGGSVVGLRRREGHRARRRPPGSVQPTNLACALAVAFALGVPHEVAVSRIAGLPAVPNRLASAPAPSGVWVIDDTFNSNPSGARAALAELAGPRRRRPPGGGHPGHGRARPASVRGESSLRRGRRRSVATDLVIVGQTNRRRSAGRVVPADDPLLVRHQGGGGGLGPRHARAG